MIGYVTVGTNDLARAAAFYDALLADVGMKRMMEFPRGIAWGSAPDRPMLAAMRPFDGEPATVGNGVMVALACADRAQVARVHAKALELGGVDAGAVGPRGDGFFAGYFRDLDGNKLNVFCMGG
jgi:catechol 2,3-dioxygenase-like lactoylglutathione lyase family enzyme